MTVAEAESVPDAHSLDAFKIFAALWAAAILWHMASYSEPLRPFQAGIVVAAFTVIWRPSSLLPFVTVVFLHLLYVWVALPFVPNHLILAATADLTILAATLSSIASTRSWRPDAGDVYRLFAPVLRIEFIVLYFFGVLHKLNADFFDVEYSCGAFMYARLASAIPMLPGADWAKVGAIYLTIAIETAIPIMLLVRRLRIAGVLLAFAFHVALALDPGEVVYNFTSMVLALLFLFTPLDFPHALSRTVAPVRLWWERYGSTWPAWLLTRGIAYVGVPALLVAHIFRRAIGPGLSEETGRAVWALYAAAVFACFIMSVWREPVWATSGRQLVTVRRPILLVFPALLVANGMMPYLGGKTETAFAMFSNLRTEGGKTNHFFIPVSLQVWDFQRDLVRVHRTSIAAVQRQADQGAQWTYFEFRSLMRRFPDASISFERGGVVTSLERVGDDPDLMRSDGPVLRKMLYFRPVPLDAIHTPCAH